MAPGDFGFFDVEPPVSHRADGGSGAHPMTMPVDEGQWRCDLALAGDGICDCGCGAIDPECEGEACRAPGCGASSCERCFDEDGVASACGASEGFTCALARYADGQHCDCGCGEPDPDCGDGGCSEAGCDARGCDVRHDEDGQALIPDLWSCDASRFDALDGCDCGCDAVDPDCALGCSEPGCSASGCDRCAAEDGSALECGWTCARERYADGERCDCGCGSFDPDCADLGCAEPGCYAPACDRCEDSDGETSCTRGGCSDALFGDGVCDCGCRERDPDCQLVACVEPGCSQGGCERCHDEAGALASCGDWSCELEGQGTGDGCNCGCGALDPDCGPGGGCAQPGCLAEGCGTCRSALGAPMSCSP